MASIEERVENLLQESICSLGYDLYDVEYVKEGKDYYLRIYIDKPDGIDLNDCETVNNAITEKLDEANYIKDAYFLEVSSTGVERKIRKNKHLEQAMGENIEVKLFKPFEKTKNLEGILTGYSDIEITLMYENDEIAIPRTNIAAMKTLYDWEA